MGKIPLQHFWRLFTELELNIKVLWLDADNIGSKKHQDVVDEKFTISQHWQERAVVCGADQESIICQYDVQ